MCSCQANWRQRQVRIKLGSLRAKFTAMRPEIEQAVQLLRQEQALAVNEATGVQVESSSQGGSERHDSIPLFGFAPRGDSQRLAIYFVPCHRPVVS